MEGSVYVRRADGGWRCVYRKGRCEAGDVLYWYGRERLEGASVWVEGVVVRRGEVVCRGGGMMEMREGASVGWEGGEIRVVGDVEGKGMVWVELEILMEGRSWWKKWIRQNPGTFLKMM